MDSAGKKCVEDCCPTFVLKQSDEILDRANEVFLAIDSDKSGYLEREEFLGSDIARYLDSR